MVPTKLGYLKSPKNIRLFIFTLNSSTLLKKKSNICTKYRAIVFKVKENQNGMSFIYSYLEKINLSELSFLLFITVCWKSTYQNPAFSKSELFINFKKNSNHYLKNVYQKYLTFLELLYK